MSLKEKIDGNELDLSLNQLTEVPVKELAAATKATRLDISCNRIRSLPREFSSLTHLVKIDLSSNSLIELPDNFGSLYNLQYLDLYSNQLVNLPVSFCRLKNLRWLDLKNNPLEPKLKSIAGDCLDEQECQTCAKKVVAYMQALDSDLEREKQKKLKADREKVAVERAKVEKELEEQRKLKKLEREKRKADSKAKKEAEKLIKTEEFNDGLLEKDISNEDEQDSAKGNYFFLKIFMFCIFAIFTTIFVYLLLGNDLKSNLSGQDLKIFVQRTVINARTQGFEALQLIKHHLPTVKENILKIVHQYLILMTRFATSTEELLSQYFH